MGLDMYLTRKKYIGAEYNFNKIKGTIFITKDGKELPIDFNKVSYIEESVGYWRKANQIHNWFVENVQDGEDNCHPHYVSFEKLEELLKVCKEVKKSIKLVDGKLIQSYTFDADGNRINNYIDGKVIEDTSVCEELLPTTSGFFFGDTEYNEWYAEQINSTIKMLKQIIKEEKELNELGFYSDFEYCSSW